MEASPGTPRSNSYIHSGDGLPTTPISASISQLQQALQSLSGSERGLAASGVDGGLLPRELMLSFSQQLRQDSAALAAASQHAGEGQVTTLLRSLSHIAQPTATAVVGPPSSDPTPSTDHQQHTGETPAAAAERHRLGSSQTFDLQVSYTSQSFSCAVLAALADLRLSPSVQ